VGCAEITLIADMERLGIARRPEDERLALGRAILAHRHAEAALALEARVHELGFPDVRAYLTDRVGARRWRQVDAAAELGVHVRRIRKLMRQHGVSSARAAAPADEPNPDGYRRRPLSAAQRALADRRRARDDEIARRLGSRRYRGVVCRPPRRRRDQARDDRGGRDGREMVAQART
jgi:hypothetical protein